MQLCCGGWGDVLLPLSANEIEYYITSARGCQPVPDWVVEIIRVLAAEGKAKFRPLKISKSPADSSHVLSILNTLVQGPCSYIQYHKTEQLPYNFIAMGDAMLHLNPMYGYV